MGVFPFPPLEARGSIEKSGILICPDIWEHEHQAKIGGKNIMKANVGYYFPLHRAHRARKGTSWKRREPEDSA